MCCNSKVGIVTRLQAGSLRNCLILGGVRDFSLLQNILDQLSGISSLLCNVHQGLFS